MSHGGDTVQPSCATVPLGKSVRRAFRAAIGRPKRKDKQPKKKKKQPPPRDDPSAVSMELSTSSLVAARREDVVRVVLKSGVVEVYPGVVLACTVIRNHPPGLCLVHPDVFRNPHGAVLRPLEPLFPGQKFLLVPETTVIKLKQKIPESSIGAFADDDDAEEEEEDGDEQSEEVTSSEGDQGYSSGAVSSEEEQEAAAAGGGSSSMPACSARDYYVAKDRWSNCRFKELVERGLAVEPSKEGPAVKTRKDGKTKKRRGKKRRDRPVPLPMGLRTVATPRRTWEPSLPSVEEEDPPSESEEARTDGRHEQ
ncbi:hypothetical protein BAE44_0007378 [Dichanthelium oligosanthes]|uniref:Uncharacterized protein n=1 Tax=Dichanthelium oligosanthes TaxID=888268 RepID=A0A1E5W2Q7_9POAL|nr:hypothetical protein BAE44_0007378 [Dichanthelium oligosanthes]